jgi:hypothetical protein
MEPNEPLEIEIQHDQKIKFETVIGILVLVILVLGAIIWYLLARHVLPPMSGEPTATTTPQTQTGNETTGDLSESATYYDITAKYPASTPLGSLTDAQPNARAVNIMKQWELDTIAQFKKDGNFAHLSHDDVQMLGLDQRKETLDISYTSARGDGTISYIFVVTADTLGAHPNTVYKTFVFDAKTGTQMSLSNLFAPGTSYLTELSTKSRALLPALISKSEGISVKDMDTGMLNDGTKPTTENFSNWYLDGSNLVIIFPPYQVAAYAAGTQKLSIPLSSFKSLKANTRVNDFGTVY